MLSKGVDSDRWFSNLYVSSYINEIFHDFHEVELLSSYGRAFEGIFCQYQWCTDMTVPSCSHSSWINHPRRIKRTAPIAGTVASRFRPSNCRSHEAWHRFWLSTMTHILAMPYCICRWVHAVNYVYNVTYVLLVYPLVNSHTTLNFTCSNTKLALASKLQFVEKCYIRI